jgi:DNA mismatch repair protein MutS
VDAPSETALMLHDFLAGRGLRPQRDLAAHADRRTGGPEQPEFFADLNLDQVLKSMTAGREQCMPLHDAGAVGYRHEVLCDLETPEVLEPVGRFAEAMRRMRQHLEQAQKLHHKLQKQAWFLDGAEIYRQAVRARSESLVR